MFIGHFAVGFGLKRVAPRAPLTVLIVAATLLDLLWPILLWLGLERVRIAPGTTAFTPLDFESYPISRWFPGAPPRSGWGSGTGPRPRSSPSLQGPPPSIQALKIGATIGSVLTVWFVWIDRTREARTG